MRMSDEDAPSNLPVIPAGGSASGETPRAVPGPRPAPPAQQPMGLPTYRTSAFVFDTAQQYADVLGDRQPGYSYSRVDNPTSDAFALGVAALEGHGLDRSVGAQA